MSRRILVVANRKAADWTLDLALPLMRRDFIRRVEKLGLPVSAVVPRAKSGRGYVEDSDDFTRGIIMGG